MAADVLQARLDFYTDNTVLYFLNKGVITTKQISAQDIALSILSEIPLNSGLLPREVLWWKQGKNGVQTALWRAPKIWSVALQEEAFKPARRFNLPMPGLARRDIARKFNETYGSNPAWWIDSGNGENFGQI